MGPGLAAGGGMPLHTAEWASCQMLQAQLAKDMEALPNKNRDRFRYVVLTWVTVLGTALAAQQPSCVCVLRFLMLANHGC